MQYVDYLKAEYQWCLDQYARLGYASYMMRAMELELKINEYESDDALMIA